MLRRAVRVHIPEITSRWMKGWCDGDQSYQVVNVISMLCDGFVPLIMSQVLGCKIVRVYCICMVLSV